MADPERPAGSKAVFLSYTTEDKAIALAVCEALREGGVEVWMDQSELQGGDAWDDHIRRQLRECALIIPIISARTQARREGYFRLEWKLADERMHLVAEGTPLIVPVVADDTQQKDALVPKSFLTIQWSRLPHGNVPPAFVTRVRRLLGLEPAGSSPTQAPMAMVSATAEPAGAELLLPSHGGSATPVARAEPARTQRSSRLVATLAVLVLGVVLGGLAVWRLKPSPPVSPKLVSRFAHDLPQGQEFRGMSRPVIAISPDGRSFVYNTGAGLVLRNLGETTVRAIPGTEVSSFSPVFSPDGQWIAFWQQGKAELQKIAVGGGVPVPIAPAADTRGLSWENDGTLLYGVQSGIWRVSAAGGKPENILPSATGELFSAPQLLPGGQAVLFASFKTGQWQVEVAALPSGERKVVVPGGRAPRYLPETGHLLYVVESNIFGLGFDLDRRVTSGSPVPVVQDVRGVSATSTSGLVNYAVAGDGTLVYLAGIRDLPRALVWVDRQGREEPAKIPPDSQYVYPRISPDGRQVAIGAVGQSGSNIFIWDLAGETRTRLALGEDGGREPLWTPDGTRIVYSSFDGRLSVKPANNARPPEVLVEGFAQGQREVWPLFFTPDGRSLVFRSVGVSRAANIGIVTLEPSAKPRSLLAAVGAALSPDGNWLAYSAGGEIYVSPFPNVDEDRVQISNEGGIKPLWSRDGRELFYNASVAGSWRLMVASVQADGGKLAVQSRSPVWADRTIEAGNLYSWGALRNYDLSPLDGRFLMLKSLVPDGAGVAPEQIFIVQNWTEELKRRVPTTK